MDADPAPAANRLEQLPTEPSEQGQPVEAAAAQPHNAAPSPPAGSGDRAGSAPPAPLPPADLQPVNGLNRPAVPDGPLQQR